MADSFPSTFHVGNAGSNPDWGAKIFSSLLENLTGGEYNSETLGGSRRPTLIADRTELAIRCALNRVGKSTDIQRLGPFATRTHKWIPGPKLVSIKYCSTLSRTVSFPEITVSP
jgi:hypothetical protein